jgi:hypothetical protein
MYVFTYQEKMMAALKLGFNNLFIYVVKEHQYY